MDNQLNTHEIGRLLSVAEVCDRLGIGRTSLYMAIRRGELRSVTIGRRRLIPVSALESYVAGLDAGLSL